MGLMRFINNDTLTIYTYFRAIIIPVNLAFMKHLAFAIVFLISNIVLSQNTLNNEKQIRDIYNYNTKEIKVTTSDSTNLFGTLITPKTDFNTILVIVSGTGMISQNAHNYLTEDLLNNNIGVFRFDKRGVGKSTGTYIDRVPTYSQDLIDILKKLKESINFEDIKLGLIGHSLGGIVTIQAIENDIHPDFLIQWSAPIGKPREIAKYQITSGINNYDKFISDNSIEEKMQVLDFVHGVIDENIDLTTWDIWKATLKSARKKGFKRNQFKNYVTNYFVEFAKIDNTEVYKNLYCPTLVIIGEEDLLVDPHYSELKLREINNKNITFKKIESLNHFMTKAGTDETTNEIYNVDATFKDFLINWIKKID